MGEHHAEGVETECHSREGIVKIAMGKTSAWKWRAEGKTKPVTRAAVILIIS